MRAKQAKKLRKMFGELKPVRYHVASRKKIVFTDTKQECIRESVIAIGDAGLYKAAKKLYKNYSSKKIPEFFAEIGQRVEEIKGE